LEAHNPGLRPINRLRMDALHCPGRRVHRNYYAWRHLRAKYVSAEQVRVTLGLSQNVHWLAQTRWSAEKGCKHVL